MMTQTFSLSQSILEWLDYKEHMVCALQALLDAQTYTDCRLVVSDGELYVNRPMLSMASAFFEVILSTVTDWPVAASMVPCTILIPDLALSTLQLVVRFIYTGKVTLYSTEMVQFIDACRLLQIRGIECSGGRVMGIYIDGSTATVETNAARVANVDQLPVQDTVEYLTESMDSSVGSEMRQGCSPVPLMQSIQTEPDVSGRTATQNVMFESEPEWQEGSGGGSILYDTRLPVPKRNLVRWNIGKACLNDRINSLCDRPALEIDRAAEADTGSSSILTPSALNARVKQAIKAIISNELDIGTASNTYRVATKRLAPMVRQVSLRMQMLKRQPNEAEAFDAVIAKVVSNGDTWNRSREMVTKKRDPSRYRERVLEAVHAIIDHGLSYTEASAQYRIHKSVLWRTAMKLKRNLTRRSQTAQPYTGSSGVQNCCMPVSDAVPTITDASPPGYETRLAAAIDGITNQGMSYREASLKYNITKPVLWRKISGNSVN
uniref:BTB domain-containing protein n=1 Tax=Anopheles maculatus TaxID=74869 RepID=A0A182SCG2_9DIPT